MQNYVYFCLSSVSRRGRCGSPKFWYLLKSITIHNIDADLAKAIEAMANSKGLSQNEVVKNLLRKVLGLETPQKPRADFSAFCGVWSEGETAKFEEAMKDFKEVEKARLWGGN